MADDIFDVAYGRIVELYKRVENNDPANSAFIVVPLEASGLESAATLLVKADLAAVLSGSTNEQTTMGRKTLTDADLASFPAPDTTNHQRVLVLPTVTWSLATGNAIAKVLVCYDSDTTSGADSAIEPLTMSDLAKTPDGGNIVMTNTSWHIAKAGT